MKAQEAMRLLDISRPTLGKYVKTGKIRAERKPNGHLDFNDEDVRKLYGKGIQRMTYIYARVSTPRQKQSLEGQVDMLKQFCFSKGYNVSGVFTDVASGISFEKRAGFLKMLDDILRGRVERVVITYKDRLWRVGFGLFKYLFGRYECEIDVMSEVGSEKLDRQEIFDEIVSMLHCYSMNLHTKRKITKVKELIETEADQNETDNPREQA
jgi:predicted site-specific integrase-resolvase